MGSSLMTTALVTIAGSDERRAFDDEELAALVVRFYFKDRADHNR